MSSLRAGDLLEALTLKSADELFDMERLETVGDVFLKYRWVIILQVQVGYLIFPQVQVGYLIIPQVQVSYLIIPQVQVGYQLIIPQLQVGYHSSNTGGLSFLKYRWVIILQVHEGYHS